MSDSTPTPVPPVPANPWDRREGEPAGSYSRFLVYRNLGPGRSIEAAHRRVALMAKGGERRAKAPGAWQRAAKRFDWVARATAWDLHHLEESGRRAVVAFVGLITEAAVRSLRSLVEADLKPQTWDDILKSLAAISQLIPPETVAALASDPPAQPPPAQQALTGSGRD